MSIELQNLTMSDDVCSITATASLRVSSHRQKALANTAVAEFCLRLVENGGRVNKYGRCCGGLFYATSLTSRSDFFQKSLVNEAMHADKELTLQLIDVFNAGFQDLFALVILQQVFKISNSSMASGFDFCGWRH